MIKPVNTAFNVVCGALMRPFEAFSPWAGISAASLVLAVLALLVFKAASDQRRLKQARSQMLARVLELQIYKDDLAGIFGAFGRILAAIGRYTGQTLKPLIILLAPMVLFIVQLAGWYEFRPLRAGESFTVAVQIDSKHDVLTEQVGLAAAAGLTVETDTFQSRAENEAVWRVRAEKEQDDQWVDVAVGGQDFRKSITVAPGLRKVSPARVRDGVWARLAHPSEDALPPEGPVLSIAVDYPAGQLSVGMFDVHWLLALFVLSMVFGFVLKKPMRVEF